MHPLIQQKHRHYYSETLKFNDLLNKFSNSQLNVKPNSGSWSALEVFEHLILSETRILESCKTRMTNGNPMRSTSIGMYYRSFILSMAMILPLKFSIPSRFVEPSQSALNADDLRIRWKNLHDEWERFLNDYSEKDLNLMIFKHPRAGYLNIEHTLRFMRLHLKHHQFQLKRIYTIVKGLE